MSSRKFPAHSIVHSICFILVHLIIINIAKGQSSTSPDNNNKTLWESVRSKRSLYDTLPQKLKLPLHLPTGEEIDLTWVKTEPYLANGYLPVLTSSLVADQKLMDDLGEFLAYHDLEKNSAVIYFQKTNTLYGVVGLDYVITDLPCDFNMHGVYQGPAPESFITLRQGTPTHSNPLPADESTQDTLQSSQPDVGQSVNSPSVIDPGPSSKRQRTERSVYEDSHERALTTNVTEAGKIRNRRKSAVTHRYYLETLVLITRDVSEFLKTLFGEDHYKEWMIKYCIMYLNAVDMAFQKLRRADLTLRINIAKIIIEDASWPFEFMSEDALEITSTAADIREYLAVYDESSKVFPPDSFDYVFVLTTHTVEENCIAVPGASGLGANMYDARKNQQYYQEIPITVMGFNADFLMTVHEIGKILEFEIDPPTEGLNIEIDPQNEGPMVIGQCNSIMQKGGCKCGKCLKWSDRSVSSFNKFFRENIYRCFLLNEPRSTRVPGPSRLTTTCRQCQCYGFTTYARTTLGGSGYTLKVDGCALPLPCRVVDGSESRVVDSILPLDGTPCARNKKVCWDRKCVAQKWN